MIAAVALGLGVEEVDAERIERVSPRRRRRRRFVPATFTLLA
jgi:hypothetical protein